MKPEQTAPIFDFSPEDDLGHLPLRYVPIQVRKEETDHSYTEAHRHNYFELFFFTKGGGTHLIDFIEYEIADYSTHLVRPGQVHQLKRVPEAYGAVVHFSKDTAIHLAAAYSLLQGARTPMFYHDAADFMAINTLLELLRSEQDTDQQRNDILVGYLSLLLLKGIATGSAATLQQETTARQIFTSFQQLAEAEYRNSRLPAWYAQQLHITEKKLNEACKEATGNTVSYYLKERIMLEAKRLLSHSSGTIKEIGYHLGFDDPAYFTRFFSKNAGQTAGDFRSGYK
ncbi:MAG: AraC family transcriptional regulator [Flavipsychrobacter sp.]|nr:AraC family transcriptional regulator [Flavipsychrobacter sp.]